MEIEVEPSEIPLATELFVALRGFASQGVVRPRNAEQTFSKILQLLEEPGTNPNDLVKDVVTLLELGELEPMSQALFTAFIEVAFPVTGQTKSCIPLFLGLLPRLPDVYRMKLRDGLIPYVVKHLTAKRPLECSRSEFFAQAEAFAAMVAEV